MFEAEKWPSIRIWASLTRAKLWFLYGLVRAMIIWSSFGAFIVNSGPKKDEWWTSDQGHGPEKLTDAWWDRRLAHVIMSYCSSHCWKKCMLVQDVRMHSVSQFTVYSAALLQNNEFPSWLLYTPESTNNGRMNIRTWPWRNGRRQPGLINPILLYIMWIARCVWVVYQDALWENGNPAESLMLWAMFSWRTLGPAVHVGATNMYQLPKHCLRACPPFNWNGNPWWLWPLLG